jgi:hypothetical protein
MKMSAMVIVAAYRSASWPRPNHYQRRRAQGDGTGEAVRALKRRIARAVYQHLKQAQQASVTAAPPAA